MIVGPLAYIRQWIERLAGAIMITMNVVRGRTAKEITTTEEEGLRHHQQSSDWKQFAITLSTSLSVLAAWSVVHPIHPGAWRSSRWNSLTRFARRTLAASIGCVYDDNING